MEEIINSIILGIVQGLTEFLPVSSSGHLEIVKALLNDGDVPEESITMTVILHLATALSTVVIFRSEIAQIFKGLFSLEWNDDKIFSLKIIISMLPAGIVGVVFKDEIDKLFDGNMLLVGPMLLVTGILLILADRAQQTDKSVSYFHAIIIGISQAIAILPGISRSGATISTSVLLGVDKEKAARFSFLMVVPLIFGKIAKDILDGGINVNDDGFSNLAIGFVAAFVTGLFACKWMIQLVKKGKLTYFAIYCFIVGAIAIFASL